MLRTDGRCAAAWFLAVLMGVSGGLTALPVQSAGAVEAAAVARAAASITTGELKTYVDVLADDTFEGREAGSRGGRAAGNYLIQAFERRGLVPAGDSGSYGQSFGAASRNILGLVAGSDPALKDEVILLGAHYDHVGYGRQNNSFGPWGYIHNGADDNASGVAAVLEVIDAIQQLAPPPRRSILFALWDGEEQGLLGSRYWLARPTVPLARLRLAINLDMVGRMRGGQLEVYGIRTARGLRRIVSEANGEPAARLKFDWTLKADSDHWPFYERRVPILMFHTGLHSEYHRPSDDAHLINHDGLASAARIAFHTIVRYADADELPPFREAVLQESPATARWLEQPVSTQQPRFGIPFRVAPGDPPKLVLTGITPGSPADKSGLRTGDELLELNGEPIRDEARLRLLLLAARGETTFLVQRPGVETPQLYKVTPLGEPIRIGVTWRMDDGEPGTAIVSQVIFGSAAQLAGLAVGDRLYSIGGQPFRTQEELITLLTTAKSPLALEVEREGKIRTVELQLVDLPPPAQ